MLSGTATRRTLPFLVLLLAPNLVHASPIDDLAQSIWNLFRMGSGQVQIRCEAQGLQFTRPLSFELSWKSRDDGRFLWRLEGVLEESPGPLSLCAVSNGKKARVLLAAPGRAPWARLFPLPPPRRKRGLFASRRTRGRRARRFLENHQRPPKAFRRRLGRRLRKLRVEKTAPWTYVLRTPKKPGWIEIRLDPTTRYPLEIKGGQGQRDAPGTRSGRLLFQGYRKDAPFKEDLPLPQERYLSWNEATDPQELLAWLAGLGIRIPSVSGK